jgi:tetratricopeptide (TPR) repeat protein
VATMTLGCYAGNLGQLSLGIVMIDTFTLAQHYLDIGQPQKALEALARHPDTSQVTYWILRSKAYFHGGFFSDAWNAVHDGLRLEPENTELLYFLALLQSKHVNLNDAYRTYQKLLSLQPENPVFLAQYAHALGMREHFDEANDMLNKALELAPEHPAVREVQVYLLYSQGEFNNAIKRAKELLKHNPDDSWAHYILGHSLAKSHNIYAANQQFRKAVALEPRSRWFRVSFAESHYETHPLMLPLYPLQRFGATGLVVTGFLWLVVFLLTAKLGLGTLGFFTLFLFPGYLVYITLVPRLLRSYLIWRHRK